MSLYKVFLEAKYCLNAILIVLKKLLKCKCEKILETQSVLIPGGGGLPYETDGDARRLA